MYTVPDVRALKASFIVHATEDEERVKDAVSKALGLKEFKAVTIRGHYGNPIRYYRARLSGKEAKEAFKSMLTSLGDGIDPIIWNYKAHVNGSHFYLRLDKQSLISGRLRLKEEDAVRIEVVFKSKGELKRWIESVRLQG